VVGNIKTIANTLVPTHPSTQGDTHEAMQARPTIRAALVQGAGVVDADGSIGADGIVGSDGVGGEGDGTEDMGTA
jgi:hypothetical protein